MIHFLLTASILAWPFGQLLSLTPWGMTLRFQLLDLLAALLFVWLFLTRRRQISRDPLFWPFSAFVFTSFLSLLANAGSVTFISLAYLLRFVSYSAFYFAFRLEGVKQYSRYLLLAVLIFLTLGLLQYFFLPDVRFLRYLGFDDHYYRLIGPLLDPNYTGLTLAVLIILAPGWLALLPLAILVLTFSRASYISLAFGLVYRSLSNRRPRSLLLIALLGLALYLVPKPFGEGVNLWRTFSIASRWQNQRQAFQLFIQKPLFGFGFNTLKHDSPTEIPNLTSGVDNSFLFVLVTTGLIGFAAFLNFLRVALSGIEQTTVKTSLIVILVHSLFNNSLFYSWILAFFLLLISLRPKAST